MSSMGILSLILAVTTIIIVIAAGAYLNPRVDAIKHKKILSIISFIPVLSTAVLIFLNQVYIYIWVNTVMLTYNLVLSIASVITNIILAEHFLFYRKYLPVNIVLCMIYIPLTATIYANPNEALFH